MHAAGSRGRHAEVRGAGAAAPRVRRGARRERPGPGAHGVRPVGVTCAAAVRASGLYTLRNSSL